MPYSPRNFALIMIALIGIAAVKLALGGYLLATMEPEAQIEPRARDWAAAMLPRERPEVHEAAGYLASRGELRAHTERFNRGLDNLGTGGYIIFLVAMVLGERRARLARNEPASAPR